MSDGLRPVLSTSVWLAWNEFRAGLASVMIVRITFCSLTCLAPRHFVFLTSVSEASCFQDASLNAPSVTMFFASVQWLPYLVTAALLTGRNELWASCCGNQASGEISWILIFHLPSALIPTFDLSALQLLLPGSQDLYASAPLMPKN